MSEVVRWCSLMKLKCEAMWLALYGYVTGASHGRIEQKHTALGKHQEYLEQLVGKERMQSIVVQTYTKVVG